APLGLRGPGPGDRSGLREGPGRLPRGARDPATGALALTRAERLARMVAERELDLLIVGDLVTPGESGRDAIADVFWLTGFSGTSGVCVVGPGRRDFLTDFRYTERAEREVAAEFDRVTVDRQLVPALAARVRGRVGYDDGHPTVR